MGRGRSLRFRNQLLSAVGEIYYLKAHSVIKYLMVSVT